MVEPKKKVSVKEEPKKEVSVREERFPYLRRYRYQFKDYTKEQLKELLTTGIDIYNDLVKPSVEQAAEELLKEKKEVK